MKNNSSFPLLPQSQVPEWQVRQPAPAVVEVVPPTLRPQFPPHGVVLAGPALSYVNMTSDGWLSVLGFGSEHTFVLPCRQAYHFDLLMVYQFVQPRKE